MLKEMHVVCDPQTWDSDISLSPACMLQVLVAFYPSVCVACVRAHVRTLVCAEPGDFSAMLFGTQLCLTHAHVVLFHPSIVVTGLPRARSKQEPPGGCPCQLRHLPVP